MAVVAVWASDYVSDTERYVQTVAPLADDPAVQAAVTDKITAQVFTYVDVGALTKQGLDALNQLGLSAAVTGQLSALSRPLTGAVDNFVRDRVGTFVASPQFANAWEQANRVGHEQLVKLLEGEQTGALSTANGAVTLDLGPVVAQVNPWWTRGSASPARSLPSTRPSCSCSPTRSARPSAATLR